MAVLHHEVMSEAVRADLGYLEARTRVSVELSGCARVRLLEAEAMAFLQFGLPFVYYGGVYGPGTVTLAVPESGYWWHVVDVEGLGSASVSSVRIQRRKLVAA